MEKYLISSMTTVAGDIITEYVEVKKGKAKRFVKHQNSKLVIKCEVERHQAQYFHNKLNTFVNWENITKEQFEKAYLL